MRRILGWILLFVGAFLLVTAIVLVTVAPGLAERTPLNVDSSTFYTGHAQKLNPQSGAVEDVPVKVLTRTKVDHKKSDGDVVVFVSYTCANIDRDNPPNCLKGDDDRLITDSTEAFATDRSTGEAVNSTKYAGSAAGKHDGLQNKWPFNTKKKGYAIMDGVLGKAVPATYQSTTSIQGLKVYKFTSSVPKTDAKIAGDVEGTYAADTSYFIEPKTGSIIKVERHESRLLPDDSIVLDMTLKYSDATVKANVKDGKSNVRSLSVLTVIGPIVTGILGVLALVAGFLMLRGGRRSDKDAGDHKRVSLQKG